MEGLFGDMDGPDDDDRPDPDDDGGVYVGTPESASGTASQTGSQVVVDSGHWSTWCQVLASSTPIITGAPWYQ